MNAKIANAFGLKGRAASSLERDVGQWILQRVAASEQGAV